MAKSIKANYVYTVANTFLGLIFPLITFPYISRVLQPEGVGLYNFYSSILSYIGLFANIGISLYATRKIAQHREDTYLRSKLSVEIFLLNIITMICAYSTVFILDAFVPRIHENQLLFLIMSISVILGPLSINWFFQAIEDFKYITLRSLFVKFISFILLLTFVRTKDDIMIYAIVVLIASVGNNIFNFVHLRKYLSLANIEWRSLQIFRHLRPSLILFILNVVISIYVNLDTVMLGFIQSDTAVGYYSVAGKISHIILSLVTSLGVVLLPRFSYLLESKNYDEFNRLCRKSLDFTFGLSLPIVVGLIFLSYPLIVFVFGIEYAASVRTLQFISPIILFAGITNVLGIQILYPKGKENLVIYSTLGAASVNLALNTVLIPSYSFNGAAVATCVAEFIVLILQLLLGKKYLPKHLFTNKMIDYFIASLLMGISLYILLLIKMSLWLQLVSSVCIGISVYGSFLLYRKNALAIGIVKTIKSKIKWI